jgi:hypothetical protein
MKAMTLLAITCLFVGGCKQGEQGPAGPEGEQGPPGPSVEDSLGAHYEALLDEARPIHTFIIVESPRTPFELVFASDAPDYTYTWTTDEGMLVIVKVTSDSIIENHYFPLALIRQATITILTTEEKTVRLYY